MKIVIKRTLLTIFVALLASCAGCPAGPVESNVEPEGEPEAVTRRPVRVLVIDDPSFATALQRQWQARSEQPIKVEQASAADVTTAPGRPAFAADVVVYPSGLLGTLAESGYLEPLAEDQLENVEWERADIFDLIRLRECVWGEQTYAVPFGSPQLTLWYRQDVLEKLGEQPPTTWADYQRLVERCGDRSQFSDFLPPDEVWSSTSEPLGAGWAGLVLLARASTYARHPSQFSTWFDRRTMKPLIDGPPLVRALDELAAAARFGPADVTSRTPREVREDFLSGSCAFALTWPSAATKGEVDLAAGRAAGFAPLPGSSDVFNFRTGDWEQRRDGEIARVPLLAVAGRLASLTRSGRRSSASVTMMNWLGGRLVGDELGPQSAATTLFRRSQVSAARRWVNSGITADSARQYGEAVEQIQTAEASLLAPRLPGRDRYLAALDEAVHRVIAGSAESEEALRTAAEQWEAITNELGRDAQRRAYSRSIGLEP